MSFSIRHLSDRDYAVLITAVFVIFGGFFAYHHEMWRDEIQAWLLARDSASIIDLFKNLKYEGHPGLWHLCLMPLSRITRSPVIMQVFHLMIAGAAVYVFSRFSPFPRFQKALFIFGYFIFYEYGVICRNYAPGVLLLFIFCALFKRRFARFPLVGLVLLLLAHTSVHCLIIAIVIGTALFIEYLFTPKKSIQKPQIYIGFTIIALGIATAVIQLKPPADTGFAVAWITKYDSTRLKNVFRIIERAFVPIPRFTLHFWNSNILGAVTWKPIISGAVLLWAIVHLLKKPVALFVYVCGTVGLLTFFYAKYYGSMRHHGFLFILLVVSAWISYYCNDMKRFKHLKGISSTLRRYSNISLSLILAAQLVGGVAAASMDYLYPFSQAKSVAHFVKEAGMENATMVGNMDFAVSTITGYLGNKIYYARGDRLGSFVIWDKSRIKTLSPDDVLKKAKELADLNGQDVVIILNFALKKDIARRYSLAQLSEFKEAVVSDEVYYLYLMKTDGSR